MKLRKLQLSLILTLVVFGIIGFSNTSLAVSGTEDKSISNALNEIDTMSTTFESEDDLFNPSAGIDSIDDFNEVVLGRILGAFFGVMGSLALLFFIYGAIMWMMSEGNEQQLTKAQKIMVWSAIGAITTIIGASFFMFALKQFLKSTGIDTTL